MLFRSNLSPLQSVGDSIDYTLDPGTQPGDAIRFIATISNGWYSENDTISQIFGNPAVLFNDDASGMSNWNTSGTWSTTPEDYVSAPSSITDSPFNNYQSNDDNSIVLATPVNLAGALDAELTFSAKWNLEAGYDYEIGRAHV